jgi:hypothetical protein
MDPDRLSPGLAASGGLVLGLLEVAELAARRAMKSYRYHYRRRVGATLRPGAATPLWNELVKQTRPLLRKRGSKAQLARLLKLPRQRLQDCLKAKTACLDAERTLLLMCWVASRQQHGREPIL